MKSVGGYITLVAVLVLAGGVAWFAAQSEERLAAAEYSLVTLRYDRAAAELEAATRPGLLDPIVRRLSPASAEDSAAASYWLGDDEALKSSEDPAVKLLNANAEFRALHRDGAPWQTAVGRLDAIAKLYADVIRQQPDNEDAAYNYELVLRLRTTLAKSRQDLEPGDPPGVTVHGVPGAPPPEAEGSEFKIRVPLRPEERQDNEGAGGGPPKVRRG